MKLHTFSPAALLAAFVSLPAHAFTVDVVDANGNDVDSSFSLPGMLSVEFGLKNALPVTLGITSDAGDPASLAFNAALKNLIGDGFERITFALQGATFTTLGSAAGTFGSMATVSGSGALASVSFAGPEYVEAYIGDWFLDGTGSDFAIDLAGATGPVSLTITASVPEPESYALMLAGLALIGFAARRRG